MRKENRTTNAFEITENRGYHSSRFDSIKLFTSDRFIALQTETVSTGSGLETKFTREDGKPVKGYGIEMETECNYVTDTRAYRNIVRLTLFNLFPADFWKVESDCSLGGYSNGEIVSQIGTKEFYRNNYRNFKQWYNEFMPAFGITCQNETCGMHVNVSLGNFGTSDKQIEESIRKFYYFVNKHYDFCKVLFNRTNSTRYCARMSYENAKTMDLDRMSASHGNCLNYSHIKQGRIEIRLVGGQKNFGCFRNTMESVFFLVENMRNLKWDDLDDLTKVFSGCNNYVFDRLNTNCLNANVITSAQVQEIRNTVKMVEYI